MGFFKPDSSDVVYDVAFKDLQLAVDWTRRNAAALDGDPEALMALGRGSGAFMLATTMISREHHVGFRRMLLQGLYPTMPLSLNTPSMGRGYMNSMARFLGCESGDPSELLSCLKEAPQERLLKAARHIDIPLRFVPARFEGYSVGDISDHDVWKFDADVDIILGSALSLGEEFNDEYLLPYAASLKSAYDPERFLRSVCFFLKERACTIRGGANRTEAALTVKGVTEQQLEEDLAHLWTTCASRAMANVAVLKNATVRHYATATSDGLFDPPLTLADVAAFLKTGTVPPLRSGLPWPVYERDGVSRSALWPNSSEETIGQAANEICGRTRAFARYLY
ncbi:acetylcholinesterase 4-like isoform X1 [Dermacentor variabilis]|uniref:acetylcholinesterase 4-like isoform X1 n=1 Tax=Dermacentor variabilis TaxID=34621 RepID=UPI003F5C8F76